MKNNLFLFLIIFLTSCIKDNDFSVPEISCNLKGNFSAVNYSLKELYEFSEKEAKQIEGHFVIDVFCISSDLEKNHFNVILAQDFNENPKYSIQLNISKSNIYNDFPFGSKIRIYLKNLFVQKRNNTLILGSDYDLRSIQSVNINQTLTTTCDKNNELIPIKFSNIRQALKPENEGKFIELENVQFSDEELEKTIGSSTSTQYRVLKDFSGILRLRTSSFSSFQSEKTPTLNGSIKGILFYNNNEYQLVINRFEDINFNKERQFFNIHDSFNNFSLWKIINVTGSQRWQISSFQNNNYAKISGFFGGKNNENESWLISNNINIPQKDKNYFLSFDSDIRFFGNPIEVLISENYVSGNPNSANWQKINAKLDRNNAIYKFENSGEISLNSFKNKQIKIAFKYISNLRNAPTWQIDNFKIIEK